MSELITKVHQHGINWEINQIISQANHGTDWAIQSQVHTSGVIGGFQDTFSGVKNPWWRAQIKQGHDATTSMTGVRYKGGGDYLTCGAIVVDDSPPFIGRKTKNDIYGRPQYSYPNIGNPTSVASDVENRCIRKFLEAAKSAYSSVEAGQDLGEWREAYESLIHPLHSMRNLILGHYSRLLKAKKLYRGKIPSLRKAAADSYLEWTFGWKPLALDVADAYSGLVLRSRINPTVPVSSSARSSFGGTVTQSSGPQGFSFPQLTTYRRSTSTYKMRLKGAVRVNLVNGKIPVLQALQLNSFNDFAVTAWDLLPYSFLIDYFVNIGDIINAVTFPSANITYCCKTTRTETTDVIRTQRSKVSWAGVGQHVEKEWQNGGNADLSVISVSRVSVNPSSLVPKVRFNLPVSSKPWINMIALLAGRGKGLTPLW